MKLTEKELLAWLEEVKDPEIPVLSLVDLGVITKIDIEDSGKVSVVMTPTFSGCPAMDTMKQEVELSLQRKGIQEFEVKINFDEPWNSNKISEKGRKALKEFGLAPPPTDTLIVNLDILEHVACPFCNSENTIMKSPFGPTLCRSLHYCNNCKQGFEQFKPVNQ